MASIRHRRSLSTSNPQSCRRWPVVLFPTSILLLQHLSCVRVAPLAGAGTGTDLAWTRLQRDFATKTDHASTKIVPLSLLTRRLDEWNTTCPQQLTFKKNVEVTTMPPTLDNKIPRIIHQTSKSRCLTNKFSRATSKWLLHFGETSDRWSYFFHDDIAVQRLLRQGFAEFPQLEQVAQHCLLHGTATSDLWRYLVLWVYGGVYADLDAVPTKNLDVGALLQADAFFVVEQYHLLSQWFMAVSPRHPLMFYAVQQCLARLLQMPDTGSMNAAFVTGPHALHEAFRLFRQDVGFHVQPASRGSKPIAAGHFVGTLNRSVTVVGTAEHQDEFVKRDALGALKRNEYRKMGMQHFQDDLERRSKKSCYLSIYLVHAFGAEKP